MTELTLWAVLATDPDTGDTHVLAAAGDEKAVRTELFPALEAEVRSVFATPHIKPEDFQKLLATHQSLRVSKLTVVEVTDG